MRMEEKGRKIKQEEEGKNGEDRKLCRNDICVISCHTSSYEVSFLRRCVSTSRERKRRTAGPRHFVVSQLTVKRKTVGMASRSDGRVGKDGA